MQNFVQCLQIDHPMLRIEQQETCRLSRRRPDVDAGQSEGFVSQLPFLVYRCL